MKSSLFLLPIFLTLIFCSPLSAQKINQSTKINQYHSFKDKNDHFNTARVAMEIGYVYLDTSDFEFAKKFFEYGINDSEQTDDINLQSEAYYASGFAAYQYSESIQNEDKKEELYKTAKKQFQRAVKHYSDSELRQTEKHILAFYYGGVCHYRLDEYKQATEPLDKAFRFAQRDKKNEIAMDAARLLSIIHGALDEPAKADYYHSVYQNYEEYSTAVDSLEKTKQTNQELNQSVSSKETELLTKNEALQKAEDEIKVGDQVIREREDQLGYAIILSVFIFILLIFIFRAYRFTKKAKRELEFMNKEILKQKSLLEKRQEEIKKEKSKSERLLLNILPKQTALELRENGRTKPWQYKKVTVIFTDFKGFTRFSEKRGPEEIIRELDACFNAFDNIIEKHNIEKIKTMGDGYMCAGGVPLPNDSNPYDAIKAAIEMLEFMQKRKREMLSQGKDFFEVRIGIHTGPVIAGVVGKKKFAYDIWGDTVNVASRMESSGEEGKINISGETYVHVKDKFFFSYRGKIKAKNKGEIDMFFVDGRVKYSAGN